MLSSVQFRGLSNITYTPCIYRTMSRDDGPFETLEPFIANGVPITVTVLNPDDNLHSYETSTLQVKFDRFQCLLRLHKPPQVDSLGAVKLGNFSCNLSSNFVAPLRDKSHATLPSVTPLHNATKICCSVVRIIAKSRTDFYFLQ